METKFKKGMLVVANNKFNTVGNITDITESTGTKKGLLYKVDNQYVFEDELIPMDEFVHSPNYYLNVINELKDELIKAIEEYGKILKTGDAEYKFYKKSRPVINFGKDVITIKSVKMRGMNIIIKTDTDKEIDATLNYNAHLWCYWHIFHDIECKKMKIKG